MWYRHSLAAAREVHLYHGTKHPEPLSRLEPRGGAVGVHAGTEEQARYMAGAGGTIYPVTFGLNNPLEVQDMGNDWEQYDNYLPHLQWRGHITPEQGKQLSQAHSDALQQWSEANPDASHGQYLDQNAQGIRSLLQTHGYDGLRYDNEWEGDAPSYVAFDPNQITVHPQ